MDVFLVLQILFDAVLLFGVLFLFHYSVNQAQKKKEEWEILKNIQIQEMKENLQELLATLKNLAKEVADDIQAQIQEADEKSEVFRKNIKKMKRDLEKTFEAIEEINAEKKRLEDKVEIIRTIGKSKTKTFVRGVTLSSGKKISLNKRDALKQKYSGVGFSSEVIREIYKMVDAKMDLNEVAKRVNVSRAEIQLILNLRGNRFSTPN